MTKLSEEQYTDLARINHLYGRRKAVRNEAMKEIDRIVEARTAQINDELYAVVRKAIQSGVPKRRIGLAIGTSAPQTFNRLVDNAFGTVPELHEAGEVDQGSDDQGFEIRKVGDNAFEVYLDNYLLDGDVLSGEVTFAWVDEAEEWFVQGDTALDFAVERALFGPEPDAALRAEFDKAVA